VYIIGELLKSHPLDKPLYINGNSWTGFFEVGGEEWTTKGAVLSSPDWCGHCEPFIEPIEDYPPPLEQHVQLVQITQATEEHREYLFKNQLSEEQPYSQEKSRTSFVLVGVTNVGQEFHLVPKMLLLLKGHDFRSGLLTNGLIQEQSYCRTKSFTRGFLASRDERFYFRN